jgi:hypothetical protein
MTEVEQQRKIKHRLAVLRHDEEVTGNVAATCRYDQDTPTLPDRGRRAQVAVARAHASREEMDLPNPRLVAPLHQFAIHLSGRVPVAS